MAAVQMPSTIRFSQAQAAISTRLRRRSFVWIVDT